MFTPRKSALAVTLFAAACAGPSLSNFAGTYSGTLTETYTCPTSSPAPFPIMETYTITQSNADVYIQMGSCNGYEVAGDASENVVSLTPGSQSTAPCSQTDTADGGDVSISLTGVSSSGGTLTLATGGELQVSIAQNANVGNESCTGTYAGTLTLQ
jgi:hypothetical protein